MSDYKYNESLAGDDEIVDMDELNNVEDSVEDTDEVTSDEDDDDVEEVEDDEVEDLDTEGEIVKES